MEPVVTLGPVTIPMYPESAKSESETNKTNKMETIFFMPSSLNIDDDMAKQKGNKGKSAFEYENIETVIINERMQWP